MSITPLSLRSKSYMNSPGFISKRIAFYNNPGNYQWSKVVDSNNVPLPALIIIELCSGGGGAASGILVVSDNLNKTGSVGASGGGAAIPFSKSYNIEELNDEISITVGAGGRGGSSIFKSITNGRQLGNSGEDGGVTMVGPVNLRGEVLLSKAGNKSQYILIDDNIISYAGDSNAGYCSSYVSNDARSDGLMNHHNTYSGSAGSNFELTDDGEFQYKSAGQTNNNQEQGGNSVSTINGSYLGNNGSNALKYGSGGSGGGISIVSSQDSNSISSGKGGDGKSGYVKITTIFAIDTVNQ